MNKKLEALDLIITEVPINKQEQVSRAYFFLLEELKSEKSKLNKIKEMLQEFRKIPIGKTGHLALKQIEEVIKDE